MDIHVSDEAQSAATNCKKGFSCLKRERKDLCAVVECISGKLHFIKCLNDGHCPYQRSFGDDVVCRCPVRKELFNKYQI